MKPFATLAFALMLAATGDAFLAPNTTPSSTVSRASASSALSAKYNSMDEILALFPEDKPVLINFYDAATEADIKDDIFRAKKLLDGRATLVRCVACMLASERASERFQPACCGMNAFCIFLICFQLTLPGNVFAASNDKITRNWPNCGTVTQRVLP